MGIVFEAYEGAGFPMKITDPLLDSEVVYDGGHMILLILLI